jgi:thiaminase
MTQSAMRLSAMPLLSCLVNCRELGGEVVVESPDCSYSFGGPSAAMMSAVLPRLDGASTVEELSANLGLSPAEVCVHLEVLADDELVLDASAAYEANSAGEFLDAYFRECRFRAREIFAQPFWDTLMSGRASRELVLGWGVEFYHYVEGANEHMAAGVAQCRRDPELRRWMAEHYAEEHDHSEIFLHGLVSCGLDAEQVRAALPLPSTRALINYLTELASSDTMAYAGTFGVMQAAGEKTTREGINQLYDRLSDLYPFAVGLFDAIRKHALIDVDLEHQTLVLERACARSPLVEPSVVRGVVRAIADTVEHFTLFFEGINDYYSAPDVIVPRRPVDIRTLL